MLLKFKALLKWWRHQKPVHQKHLIRSKITRSWSSSGAEELKASKAGISFNHAKELLKTERSVTTALRWNLKALNAYSIKSVEKGKMYELYNHLLHYFGRALQQDKDNNSACRNVPSYKEWIWNWSFIGQ